MLSGKLFIRNGEEVACFQLTEEKGGTETIPANSRGTVGQTVSG